MKRLAVLLLLGCGSPKPTEQVVVPVASASAVPTISAAPVASAPPPPTASAEPVACPGECNGQITPELQNALVAAVKKGHRCYDVGLATDKTLKGKLSFDVRLADDGALCSIKVGSNTMAGKKDTDLEAVPACMMRVFQSAAFPKPKAGCVDIKIPVSLEPKP